MPNYGAALLRLIDDRIDQARVVPTKMGTVQDRDGPSARAIVSFDGSSGVGLPVKCFETVVVDTGDRVGLAKVEGDWVIVGNYTPRTFADEMTGVLLVSSNTTTSATFTDMPTSPHVGFTKFRDATQIQILLAASMSSTATATVVELGVSITFPDSSSIDQAVYHRAINTASVHMDMVGGMTTSGLTLPAGDYLVTARWRRTTGSGTLTMDLNDSVTVWAREVVG